MAGLKIETPRGALVTKTGKNGKVTARLTWNPGFGPQRSRKFQDAQSFIDSEVLRLDSPYVPFQTGMLDRSGMLGTDIGSGEVCYVAPYAAAQYYGTADSRGYDAHRGGHWFERMKVDHRDAILRGAAKMAGGEGYG